MVPVRVERLSKRFGAVSAVDDLTLAFPDGELTVLLGPSGCGKTTLLRLIAGLEELTGGRIYIGDRLVNGTPPWERNAAMVFQNYALYPHMTAFDNIAYPLRSRRGVAREEVRGRVQEIAALLRIDGLLDRMPRQLSGGQMQRVALARALVRRPGLFLLDEPLSNLDAALREETRGELKRLQKDIGVTTVYVTHDQAEAMTLADRLLVMRDGRIEQTGEPEEVYDRPRNLFVAGFIGSPRMNFVPCRHDAAGSRLTAEGLSFQVPERMRSPAVRDGGAFVLGIRPECLSQAGGPDARAEATISGRAYVTEPLGRETLLSVQVAGAVLKAVGPPGLRVPIGEEVRLIFAAEDAHLFDAQTGERIPFGEG